MVTHRIERWKSSNPNLENEHDMSRALIVGGSNGIGMALAVRLLEHRYEKIYIVDKEAPDPVLRQDGRIEYVHFNLLGKDYSVFERFDDVDTLIVTAGFGRVCPFGELTEAEVVNGFTVNALAGIRIVRCFYDRIIAQPKFYCAVIGSIAGHLSSPLFSVYGASKSALCRFVENVNIELEQQGSANRILDISPGSIGGTRFNGGANDLGQTARLADEILCHMFGRETLFIPQYDEVYQGVLQRYQEDPHRFGVESYDYKYKSGRMSGRSQVKTGYLSGTFDLFHIGHLNLLRRARQYCDYLVVGVHRNASHKRKDTFIPFEERAEIVRSISYVDRVIESLPEDSDVYKTGIVRYDYLFVGSDYKGTERFEAYERYFADKGVKIVYFPYTEGTSSTQLRGAITKL